MKTITTAAPNDDGPMGTDMETVVHFAKNMQFVEESIKNLVQQLKDEQVLEISFEPEEGETIVLLSPFSPAGDDSSKLDDAFGTWEYQASLKNLQGSKWKAFMKVFQEESPDQAERFLRYFPNPDRAVAFVRAFEFLHVGVATR